MDFIKKKLKLSPNLPNYEEVYASFRWEDHLSDLPLTPDQKINAGTALIDWHLEEKKDKIALLWENDQGASATLTFGQLSMLSNKFANILTDFGVEKGDSVFTFLPRIPEIYYIFLGILKTGAVAGNFFPAFGKEALLERLKNSGSKVLVTNKELFLRVKEIKKDIPELQQIILVDEEFAKLMKQASPEFNPPLLNLSDPLNMLFTSATGNTPVSGIVTPQKALLGEFYTAKWVLDLKPDDIYWCTADPGWVTGTVYGIMMPIMLGITQVVFDGRFSPQSWYKLIEKYKVTVWYTAPTAIRMLAKEEDIIKQFDLSSLRHIVSVGEALNPSSIEWCLKNIGLPIHDTFWQTETGHMMIANYPALDIKPGSMGKPVPGIVAEIVDNSGVILPPDTEGNLVFKPGFPGELIDVWRNPDAFKRYFTPPEDNPSDQKVAEVAKSSWFYTGDRAKRDADGYYWFVGRADEVIKTSGERVGPFEVESAINKHPKILESAVIGVPDELRGQIIKAFIVLKKPEDKSEELKSEIQKFVKTQLAGHAYPRLIEFILELPKNKTGKILRKELKNK